VAELVAILRGLGGHEFWADDITLFDSQHIDATRLLDSGQVTDTYLLALAQAHGGKLATFDRHLVADAVINGAKALHLIA
jgi:predicted nucleic acid-binding protein